MSGMLHKVRQSRRATTLVELAIASAAGSVIALVAFATVEMSRRETAAAFDRTETNRNAFAVVRAIEHNVMRAATITIPDPDYPTDESMEVTIPLETGEVRRGFRRVESDFIIDYKDESDIPYEAFNGLTDLNFRFLDAPTNSLVEITCTTNVDGRVVNMRTVTKKRN